MRSRVDASRLAILAGLALAGLALGHEVTYLVAHGVNGFAAAMTERGHDRYWTSFLTVVVIAVGILGVIAVVQLRRLRRLAQLMRSNRQVQVSDLGVARLFQLFGPLWLRVSVVVLLAYFAQENAEVGALGAPLPLVGVFAGEHWVALPSLILASGLVAMVASLVRWRREVLLRKLRLVGPFRRSAAARALRALIVIPASVLSARRNGVRAPPRAVIALA